MMKKEVHPNSVLSRFNRICTLWCSQNAVSNMFCSHRINKVTESQGQDEQVLQVRKVDRKNMKEQVLRSTWS